MKASKVALKIYFLFCLFSIIGDVFHLEWLMLFSIPLIIPTLFFYYFIEKKKISVLLCLFLIFNFIGDSVGLMNFDEEINYIIVPFFISNIIIILLMMRNVEKFKFNFFNLLSIMIISSFLGYIWAIVVELFAESENAIQLKIAIFGLSLFIAAILASYNLIWKMSTSNLILLFAVTCILISDVFYIMYNFQNQLIVLDLISFL
jgi:hypothetical protein